jgi:hypothetical protein
MSAVSDALIWLEGGRLHGWGGSTTFEFRSSWLFTGGPVALADKSVVVASDQLLFRGSSDGWSHYRTLPAPVTDLRVAGASVIPLVKEGSESRLVFDDGRVIVGAAPGFAISGSRAYWVQDGKLLSGDASGGGTVVVPGIIARDNLSERSALSAKDARVFVCSADALAEIDAQSMSVVHRWPSPFSSGCAALVVSKAAIYALAGSTPVGTSPLVKVDRSSGALVRIVVPPDAFGWGLAAAAGETCLYASLGGTGNGVVVEAGL